MSPRIENFPKYTGKKCLTYIDLFCGCGGFTLGMERAGFKCLAALDFNAEAIATLRSNFPEVPLILQRDLTIFPPEQLEKLIGTNRVDVIAGGPPCQGYSNARKVDGSNHGKRLKEDPRRQLFREYLRYVEHFKPRLFVMENVLGIQSAAGGAYFTAIQNEGRKRGYRVVTQVADAFILGVPQKRKRQLIIGVREDVPGFFPSSIKPAPRALPNTTTGHAIGDLPALAAGEGSEERKYDLKLRHAHLASWGQVAEQYLNHVAEVYKSQLLTAHRARPHNARDLRDFARLREGESSAQAMRRGIVFEWPYSKEHFVDRFTRQSRYKPCSTIVAHLSKDGLMFIHPNQNRSLTPREAARIQSFPDWFQFPVARTHQFRLIGNAVPPLVAEAVGLEVRAFLETGFLSEMLPNSSCGIKIDYYIPSSHKDAALHLQGIAELDRNQLRNCKKEKFLRGWFALLYLFPDLHPDNALNHGDTEEVWSRGKSSLEVIENFSTRRFVRSGWPVALELIGSEAWRRYKISEISSEEIYCVEAQRRGLNQHRFSACEIS